MTLEALLVKIWIFSIMENRMKNTFQRKEESNVCYMHHHME